MVQVKAILSVRLKFLKDSLTKIPDDSRSVSSFEDCNCPNWR